MKTFALTIMLVLGASLAQAQNTDPVFERNASWSNESATGKSLMQALDDLRATHHFHVEVTPDAAAAVKTPRLVGTISGVTLRHAIQRMAQVYGLTVEFRGQTVVVSQPATTQTTGHQQHIPQNVDRQVSPNRSVADGVDLAYPTEMAAPQAPQPAAPSTTPQVVEAAPHTLRRASMVYQANVASGAYSAPQTDPLATLQHDMIVNGFGSLMLGPLRPPYASYGYGGYRGGYYPSIRGASSQPGMGMWWYADCNMFPNDRNCTHGDLKIDGGSERFLQGIDIHVDGANRGPASKFNNRFNHGLSLPVGEHYVQFVRVKDDMIVYETMIYVESRYVNQGNPNLVKVDKDRFNHGPHRKRVDTPRNRDLPQQEVEDVLRTPTPPFS